MFNKEDYKATLKFAFPDWPIEKIESEIEKEAVRYAFVKYGGVG